MSLSPKRLAKQVLGELPLTAELYWQLRQQGRPLSKSFSLRRTEKRLPMWLASAEKARLVASPGKSILLFATLRYWIEHATLLGMALAGMGHTVNLAYLPYANWRKPINRFDLRRHNRYAQHVLGQAAPLVKSVSFLNNPSSQPALPADLHKAVADISVRDVQYTLQMEDIDRDKDLYRLRLERNTAAVKSALAWMQENRPQVVVTPNGSILEFGAIFQVARWLGIPVVTYEFGEQRNRIWLAYDAEVMYQNTDSLWAARKTQPLSLDQLNRLKNLFASRQQASLWENFSRRWQGMPSQGGEQVRRDLKLDGRPIVLLAANVIGDSLTLGRQVFSQSMTEWLERTIAYFANRQDVQLIVRIHPGERYTQGPSVAHLVGRIMPEIPEYIHLVAAEDSINTYDLIQIADLGLVYTTTVGMEMAMSGLQVIVAGQTHYRNRGFTIDPTNWQSYFDALDQALTDPRNLSLTQAQVDQAWNYAYRFFFEFPFPFPWHLLYFWQELEHWSLESILSPGGLQEFGAAFRCLAGEPPDWNITSAKLTDAGGNDTDITLLGDQGLGGVLQQVGAFPQPAETAVREGQYD